MMEAKPIAHLVWLQGRRAADDVEDHYEVARPGDKSIDGSEPFPVYASPQPVRADPVAWVIPGADNGSMCGFIDAMAWEEGEFTRPLYASPQPVTKPAPVQHVVVTARAFMELFVVDNGIERWLSIEDIDMTELTHRFAALEESLKLEDQP